MSPGELHLIEDDYELVAALAKALREAHRSGQVERERDLAVTLADVVYRITLKDPQRESRAPWVTHVDGEPSPQFLAALLLDPQEDEGR